MEVPEMWGVIPFPAPVLSLCANEAFDADMYLGNRKCSTSGEDLPSGLTACRHGWSLGAGWTSSR